MDLVDAATFFDTDPIYDGYDGSYLFDAQASSFNDSKSDGSTDRRRIFSVGPDVVLPTRRVVQFYGDRWLLGFGTPDGFYGEVIRQHFNAKRVTDSMNFLTPAQALAQAAGTAVYVHKMFFKGTVNASTDSDLDCQWNIFTTITEPADKGSFLRDASGVLYRVRVDYIPLEGLRLLQADELDADAVQSCVFNTGVENPVTETIAGGTTAVTAIKVEVPKFYRFRAVSDSLAQAGDVGLFLPTSITLRQGLTFTMQGHNWQVVTFQPELDAQAALVRRA